MNLALRLNTGSVYWGQLTNVLPKADYRTDIVVFLCLKVSGILGIFNPIFTRILGAVSGVTNPLGLGFGKFVSTVPFLIELTNSTKRTMQKALPKSGLKALFENSIQSIELATDLTKEYKLHLYKSLLNSLNSLLIGGEV